jgi:hypothetical protein
MPSLAVVIGFEALAKSTARQPVAHRRGNLLRRKSVWFWNAIRPTRTTTPAVRRVASPPKASLPVPRLSAAH